RREIEQTRAFAEQQARTNRKLRLMTAAMALLLVLALGAAGYAVAKRNEAHANEAEAVRLAGLARLSEQEALKRRDELADALKARDAADEAKEAAQAAEARAQMAKDEALSRAIKNEARAKKEAERANEQAELAAKNLRQANEAAEAEKIARVKLQSSLERNRWSRDGLAAYQRGDYDSALGAFMIVRDSTAAEGGDRGGQVEDVETARVHGWAHAYVGATLRQLRQPAQAVESYERALPILEEVLDPDDPVRFDTYHGMAHAYREAYKTDAAEEFYNRALKFLEERTPTAPTAGGMSGPVAAKMAATLENVARLYRDLGRYDDAEPVYKRIVKLREPSGGPEFVASLKEMAQFYLGQNKYREAEALFPKMLDTQERRFIGGEGGEGDGISNFRELGDSYSELGEVYVGLGEESKAQEAFQLARAVQDYWIKARQVLRQSGGVADAGLMRAKFKEVGGEKNLAEMARLLVRLGRYKAAEGIYLELIRFYDNENEDAESAAANVALGNLYRDHLNDPEKAEEHYKVAEEAASRQGDVRPTLRRASAVLAEALRQRAALYASRPEKFSEALSLYERAHKIYEQRDSWLGENAALYGIIQMVEKQKRPVEERTLAYRRRFDALGKYVRKFGCEGCERPNDFFGIVFEYARAANDAAYVYGLARKQDDAEAVFRSVFEAWGTIKLSTFSPKALDAYARTLDSYQALLTRRGKPAEAAKVAELAKSVREKQSQFQQASEQQQLQQKYAQQQAAP
ncbi:MAG TPA: tetratricopeptide repeat protein, partial [Pyrinomonadaceae bacterium]|nr:tetratricopeptide repeat protein [Pyrinomonadaceae bacterium]